MRDDRPTVRNRGNSRARLSNCALKREAGSARIARRLASRAYMAPEGSRVSIRLYAIVRLLSLSLSLSLSPLSSISRGILRSIYV